MQYHNYEINYDRIIKTPQDVVDLVKDNQYIQHYQKFLDTPKGETAYTYTRPLPNEEEMARRLQEAVNNKKKIVVINDYDADGVMSGMTHYTMICAMYESVGLNSEEYVKIKPTNRYEGYGMSKEFRESEIRKEFDIIITTDIGISIILPDNLIKSKTQFLVFDHHIAPAHLLVNIQKYHDKSSKILGDEVKNTKITRKTQTQIKNIKVDKKTKDFIENRLLYVNPILREYKHFFLGVNNNTVEYSPHTDSYISAGQVAMVFRSHQAKNLIKDENLKYVDTLLPMVGGITVITDVMDMTYPANVGHLVNAQRLVQRFIRSKSYTNCSVQAIDAITNNKINKNITKHEVLIDSINNKGIQKFVNSIMFILDNFCSEKYLSHAYIGRVIGPFINSYGRMATTHQLFLDMFNHAEANLTLNNRRKDLQNSLQEFCHEQCKSQRGNDLVACSVPRYDETLLHTTYKSIRNHYNSNYGNIFRDIEVEDTPKMNDINEVFNTITPIEGVIGSVCSRIQEMMKATSIVGVPIEPDSKVLKGSGRSIIPFITSGMSALSSVNHMGGHECAFGATIDSETMNQEVQNNIAKKYLKYNKQINVHALVELTPDLTMFKYLSTLSKKYGGIVNLVMDISEFLDEGADIKDIETKSEYSLTKLNSKGIEIIFFNSKTLMEQANMKHKTDVYKSLKDIRYIIPSEISYVDNQRYKGYQIIANSII